MTASMNAGSDLVLPLQPGVAAQILAKLNDPDICAVEISDMVRTDPALVSRLLALANSPFFYRGREIVDIRNAIVSVGQNSVRAIALAVAMESFFEDEIDLDHTYWEDAATVAACAMTIARYTGIDSGESFCAGLLHDVGHVVMAISSSESWSHVRSRLNQDLTELHQAEVEHFGATHAHIGAQALQDLGLPRRLSEAIRTHHEPVAEIRNPVGAAVAGAVLMDRLILTGEGEEDLALALERLDCEVEVERLVKVAGERVNELGAVFART